MRRASKVDDNQNEIVKALRQIPGISVAITSGIGKGYPDLNLGWKGKTYLIELKDGQKTASRRKLTDDEIRFKNNWTGHYAICSTLDEILNEINLK